MTGKILDAVNKLKGNATALAKKSMKWFYKHLKSNHLKDFSKNAYSYKDDPIIGGMFHFVYDAKFKDVLPYWDRYPLVIPIEIYNDGFLGLNLHYLPPTLRAKLLDELLKYKETTKTKETYMNVSYKLLSSAIKSHLFQPCVKRYLSTHIKSKFIKVGSEYWEEVAFLPTQDFQKASTATVWGNIK
jgi:hypothetical protein